ncbi:MAG: bifunctional diaminohydroxyphosphoribosylaminopyrimidine deaminase/5-amino-6-(5-phosphoribosylamino)uracil reductase RibD [Nitrospirae bacterium]|nr:bifunctional diaminohydroxyphosphoribosylaminopyrimidine deaminase/5-amino-6-(5-phosphoribosylamino)uracil reductase RibD [Nitrospirota bacterium]
MFRALELARLGRGRTSPNPPVGAVVVSSGKVIGEGWHRKAGTPHAEIHALAQAGSRARGAALYVTLEPCCHRNKRTPPCVDAVLSSGVSRVVVSAVDPNPRVRGKGIASLRRAGIEVVTGILEEEGRGVIREYAWHMRTGFPFVTLKMAQSLDGKIATARGESKWITGPAARGIVQKMRAEADAVMVGAGTVRRDDPSLTPRGRSAGGRQPLRVIVDGNLSIPPGAKMLADGLGPVVIACRRDASPVRRRRLSKLGAEIAAFPASRSGIDLRRLMGMLGARGVMSVLAEGGGDLAASLLAAGVVREAVFFVAPIVIGGKDSVGSVGGASPRRLSEAIRLGEMRVEKIGRDILIRTEVTGGRD